MLLTILPGWWRDMGTDYFSVWWVETCWKIVKATDEQIFLKVGDSLLELFWPTGTGIPRGFFSAMDSMWLMRQLESGKMTVLECLAERESVHRILSQTKPENTTKDFGSYSLDPTTRYGNALNLKLVMPFQVTG